ncbi:ATP-binding protein [Solimonas marina]|uniref:histidine kinase n=1 Tax=Solimonas marina TaxID=2714601 RepID=A0A970BA20_9GAMM|nr:ATP-binding protein [Solimonas marina]NKF23934.1 hypothetical protein [Solimonas marina]
MSLRVLLGLLVAAAVVMVPTVNFALLRIFPPPDVGSRFHDCGPGAMRSDCGAPPERPREPPPGEGANATGAGDGPAAMPRQPPPDQNGAPPPNAPLLHGFQLFAFGGPPGEVDRIRLHFLWINLASLGLVVLLAMVAFSLIVRWPIRGLLVAIEDIEHGAVPAAGGMSAPSELRQIGAALHGLAHQLRGSNQERELMLAGMSHDLRSPLARIQAAIELRSRPDEDWAPVLRDVREIDHIIGQCIDYVRDGRDEAPVTMSLDAVVHSAIRSPDDAFVELDLAAPTELNLRRQSLSRAIRNLIDNAATHGVSPIRLQTRIEGDWAVLTLEDHGPGIEPAHWARLLQPFAQGSPARNPGGAGLGLAIAHRVALQHGGELSMRAASREGSPFALLLRLPVRQLSTR